MLCQWLAKNGSEVGEEAYVRGASSYVCNFCALSMFRKGNGRVNVVAQCILPQVMLTIQPLYGRLAKMKLSYNSKVTLPNR